MWVKCERINEKSFFSELNYLVVIRNSFYVHVFIHFEFHLKVQFHAYSSFLESKLYFISNLHTSSPTINVSCIWLYITINFFYTIISSAFGKYPDFLLSPKKCTSSGGKKDPEVIPNNDKRSSAKTGLTCWICNFYDIRHFLWQHQRVKDFLFWWDDNWTRWAEPHGVWLSKNRLSGSPFTHSEIF